MRLEKEHRLKLREEFEKENEINWINSQGEPNLDYVLWLEDKVNELEETNKK